MVHGSFPDELLRLADRVELELPALRIRDAQSGKHLTVCKMGAQVVSALRTAGVVLAHGNYDVPPFPHPFFGD